MRMDENHNDKTDLSKDVIVFDGANMEWRYASDTELNETKVREGIEKNTLEKLRTGIQTEIQYLHTNLQSYANNKTALKNDLKKINTRISDYNKLRRLIVSTKKPLDNSSQQQLKKLWQFI